MVRRYAAVGRRAGAGGTAAVLSPVVLTLFLLPSSLGPLGQGVSAPAVIIYPLPRSAFEITDHNLTFATNMVSLAALLDGSFDLKIVNDLVSNASRSPTLVESEIAIGPLPPTVGVGDETYITPIFIIQEAASGLLRVEYVPFNMNDTYGFIVYQGYPVASGSAPFASHTLDLAFVASAPPVAAYAVTLPFGGANGNVSLSLDGSPLVSKYPVEWANFAALYAYGLTTGSFAAGNVSAVVTPLPTEYSGAAALSNGAVDGIPDWVVSAAIAAVVGGAVVAIALRGRHRAP